MTDITECRCDDTYSVEPHGKGYALYYGRCAHRHGYKMASVVEVWDGFDPRSIAAALNSTVANVTSKIMEQPQ